MKKNTVRIISGKYRGRKINILPNSDIRPTPDRVRETLYNWLCNSIKIDLNSTKVLDLFTGSGANSIEAISRGAGLVVANDYNSNIIKHLQLETSKFNNNNADDLSNLIFIDHDTLKLLTTSPKQNNLDIFDLIILDPPFNKDYIYKCIELIIINNWLNLDNTEAMIYFEAEKKLDIENILNNINNKFNINLNIIKSSTAGDLVYGLIGL